MAKSGFLSPVRLPFRHSGHPSDNSRFQPAPKLKSQSAEALAKAAPALDVNVAKLRVVRKQRIRIVVS
jgi:hypothetical protein